MNIDFESMIEADIPNRLRDFAFAIDDDGCKTYCYGKCIDGECVLKKAADIIDKYLSLKNKKDGK